MPNIDFKYSLLDEEDLGGETPPADESGVEEEGEEREGEEEEKPAEEQGM